MGHYKIKLEDKAAFLNRLEKQDIQVDSYDIIDNKYEGYFEIDIENESDNDIVKSILNKSPKINTIKEMRQQITKTQLKQIIREELGKMKGINEYDETNSGTIGLGMWALKNYPEIKAALGGNPEQVGDALIMMVSFVPVVGGVLAGVIAAIKNARKAKVGGAMAENEGDGELADIVAKIKFPK
jgi:hypothetical protein